MNIKLRHILLYLLIISVAAMGASFSRFSTTLTNTGAENSELPDIEFSTWIFDHGVVDGEGHPINLKNMVPGDDRTVIIRVNNYKSNGEEVVSGYDQSFNLELETTGNLPLRFTLAVNEDGQEPDVFTGISFARIGPYYYISDDLEFKATEGKETKKFKLTIEWPDEADKIDEYYKHEIDYIELRIRAVQAQPNEGQNGSVDGENEEPDN